MCFFRVDVYRQRLKGRQVNEVLKRQVFVVVQACQVSSRMGNANTRPIFDTLFEAGILRCRHTPTIELTVPDHQACQACCRWQLCESHDPANPGMLTLKRAIHTLTNLASATPTPTPTPTTSGQSDGNVQAGNSGNRRIITLLFF